MGDAAVRDVTQRGGRGLDGGRGREYIREMQMRQNRLPVAVMAAMAVHGAVGGAAWAIAKRGRSHAAAATEGEKSEGRGQAQGPGVQEVAAAALACESEATLLFAARLTWCVGPFGGSGIVEEGGRGEATSARAPTGSGGSRAGSTSNAEAGRSESWQASARPATTPSAGAAGLSNADSVGALFGANACWQDAEVAAAAARARCFDPASLAEFALLSPEKIAQLRRLDPEELLQKPLAPAAAKPDPPPQLAVAATPPPPPPPPPAAPPPTRPQQIVETANANSETAPENARFLSEHNTKVEKETVARGAVAEPMVAKPKAPELNVTRNASEASSTKVDETRAPGLRPDAPDAPGRLGMRTAGVREPVAEAQAAKERGSKDPIAALGQGGLLPKRGDAALSQALRQTGQAGQGDGGGGGGAPRTLNLRPQEVLERRAGGGSVDHLEGVASGDETALNSKQFVHASFFNRMKRQVAQQWQPAAVFRRAHPNAEGATERSWPTEVRVTLLPDGSVGKVVVVKSSGMRELDEEAIRAFRTAGPFANVPAALVQNGSLTFEFGFFFSVGGTRTMWRAPAGY